MPKLPRVSGREVMRAFERAGRTHSRTTGDHMIMTMTGKRSLVVPDYDNLPPFILRGLIRTEGLTVDQFIDLL
jgi:predicted RNA binding protein YcfA (HicA-like mRNA interferase family)